MSIGLYDVDFMKYRRVPFNLELMKLASYYKRKKEVVVLAPKLEPEHYQKFIIRKDYIDDEFDKRFFESNVEYGGLAFTNNKYNPLKEEIELTKPDTHLYDKFKNEFCANTYFNTNAEENLIKKYISAFNSLVRGAHVRLSLDNKTLWKDFLTPVNLSLDTRVILCHDYNLNSIEHATEAIQEIIDRIPSKNQKFLGTKFPIQVNNQKDFIKWLNFLHSFFFSIQYNGLMENELYEEILTREKQFMIRNRFIYNPVDGLSSENEFIEKVLPKIFKQVLLSRSKGLKISLTYTNNFFKDKRWERLIELFNLYSNSKLITNYKKIFKPNYKDLSNTFTLYNYVSRNGYMLEKLIKKHFTKEELRDLFQLVREKSYETFKMFYESCIVELKGGEIVDV